MRIAEGVVLSGVLLQAAYGGTPVLGDSRKGGEVFTNQKCVVCHSVNGQGGKTAPDLGKRVAREFTPSLVAGLMWNHAPAMWSAIAAGGLDRPQVDAGQAADLFAYFASVRFFEHPGDAARGSALFKSKGCAGCHAIEAPSPGAAKPVAEWDSVSDSIALAQRMWNHAPAMRQAVESRKLRWPSVTSQELSDILVYLQNLPQLKHRPPNYAPASAETGEILFQAKGCTGCHGVKAAVDKRFANRTMTDFAASMWNHGARLTKPLPEMNAEEMRRIVGYLESLQVFDQQGNAAHGKKVFETSRCGNCHNQPSSGAPSLAGMKGQFSSAAMVSVLWQHGPAMLEKMKQQKIAWPRFQAGDMADLVAFLNSKN